MLIPSTILLPWVFLASSLSLILNFVLFSSQILKVIEFPNWWIYKESHVVTCVNKLLDDLWLINAYAAKLTRKRNVQSFKKH